MIEHIPLIRSVVGWVRSAGTKGKEIVDAKAIGQQAAFDKDRIALYKQIADAEQDIRELRRQVDSRDARIRELEDTLSRRGRINLHENAVYVSGEGIPYCQTCYGSSEKLIPLTLRQREPGRHQVAECGNCKNMFVLAHPELPETPQSPPPARSDGMSDFLNQR
jgi:hypothetical protein